jgi:hypothetical protein
MTWPFRCIVILLISCFFRGYNGSSAFCQPDTSVIKSGLFDNQNYLELKVSMDFDFVLNDTADNPSYHPVHISYKNDDSLWISLDAEVRVRGHFRKQSENCDFPPLKLRFDKKSRTNTIFENARELKMVTHCQSGLSEYGQFVVQEYLIYRLYEVLSDICYKTRLVKVTYTDIKNPVRTLSRYAFFVEDNDLLEERLKGHIVDVPTVMPENIDRDHYVIISFFQYMIVNTDWSLPIMHNITLISLDYFKPPVPVPYDFDWSGLINIPYKVPTIAGMQTRVPERIYKGPCLKNKEAKKFKKFFEDKKEDLFNVYIDCKYINDDIKIESLNKLQLFYQILEDKYIFNSVFMQKCK